MLIIADSFGTDPVQAYGVTTKMLNQAVKRNRNRFPDDFVFQVTASEAEDLLRSRSQSVTLKRGQNIKYLPFAFTEHGAIMAATVLNSPRAVQMSVFVVRAFIKMREQMLNRSELEKRLGEIEKVLLSHDAALRDLYAKIRPLLLPPPDPPQKQIGFHVREKQAKYRVGKQR